MRSNEEWKRSSVRGRRSWPPPRSATSMRPTGPMRNTGSASRLSPFEPITCTWCRWAARSGTVRSPFVTTCNGCGGIRGAEEAAREGAPARPRGLHRGQASLHLPRHRPRAEKSSLARSAGPIEERSRVAPEGKPEIDLSGREAGQGPRVADAAQIGVAPPMGELRPDLSRVPVRPLPQALLQFAQVRPEPAEGLRAELPALLLLQAGGVPAGARGGEGGRAGAVVA